MKKLSLAKLDDLFAAVAATQSLYLPVDDGKRVQPIRNGKPVHSTAMQPIRYAVQKTSSFRR